MNSTPPVTPALQPEPFSQWLQRHGLDNWRSLLMAADEQIENIAKQAGIDWSRLRLRMPAAGELLKGRHIPVYAQDDQWRCAFVWHLQSHRDGSQWPCLVFMSFRQGGIQQIFHGYRWARESHERCAPLQYTRTPVRQLNDNSHTENEARWRLQRFNTHQRLWHNAPAATFEHPLLQARLGQCSNESLLSRLNVRSVGTHPMQSLMVRLSHYEHGHCGYQLLHAPGQTTSARRQELVIRQAGMKRGAFVVLHASPGHLHWPVGLCEGVFTALSVALAWPGPIAIALDAGNLSNVRRLIGRTCVLFADNDRWGNHNTGLQRANQAIMKGDRLCIPAFSQASLSTKPTDFNDLLRLEGPDALHQQIRPHWHQ